MIANQQTRVQFPVSTLPKISEKDMSEQVKIELLERKTFFGRVFEKGTILDAFLKPDGSIKAAYYPLLTIKPHQYQIYIPEQDYDKLLSGG